MTQTWQTLAPAVAIALATLATPAHAQLKTLDGLAPLVLAHRGTTGYLPEHTLGGYELAVKFGVDYIEPDLVFTKDRQLIAMHDLTLTRTTDVTTVFPNRESYAASAFTLAEIKQLTVKPTAATARTSYPGFTPSAAEPFRIPTFQEVITLAKAQSVLTGREIGIYPEAKIADPEMEDKILSTLIDNGYTGSSKVFVQSFNAATIQSFNTKQTAAGYDFKLIVLNSAPSTLVGLGLAAIAGYADGVGSSINNVDFTRSFVEAAHAAGLAVHGYTFNKSDPATALPEYQKFFEMGIDGVFSNYSDLAIQARSDFLAAAIPEPQTWALMALGIAGLAFVARRRQA